MLPAPEYTYLWESGDGSGWGQEGGTGVYSQPTALLQHEMTFG